PGIAAAGSIAEGMKSGDRSADYFGAMDRARQVGAVQQNPNAYASAGSQVPSAEAVSPGGMEPGEYKQANPKPEMPTLSRQDQTTIARGAPRGQDKIALEGAQAVRDQLA